MYAHRLFILYSKKTFNTLFKNNTKSAAKHSLVTRAFSSKIGENQTAGLVVIGDEILKGQVEDSNTNFIAKKLYGLGVKLVKVSIVGDDVEEISNEIKKFSSSFKYVITTGGIGPTHDDVTYEAVAHAFGEPLVPHPELLKLCKEFFQTSDLSSPALKLAHIPKSGILNYGYDKKRGVRSFYPTVSVHNVYIFPGVSQLMKNSFNLLSEDLFGKNKSRFHMKELFLFARETDIADNLNKAVAEYPSVTFGSYPNLFNSYYGVKLTVESVEEHLMEEAYQKLKSLLPEGLIVNYDSNPIDQAYFKIQNLLNGKIPVRKEFGTTVKESVKDGLKVLEECAKRYSSKEVAICFTGGKDSTVLLHLWHAVLSRNGASHAKTSIQAVMVEENSSFPELDTFVQEAMERYRMDLVTVKGTLKSGIKEYLSLRPEIKALIFGTRINDPGCEALHSFVDTDTVWPHIIRIYPIYKWNYADVWNFMLSLNLPYCHLYDIGYTSLGSADETLPNPRLAANKIVYTIGVRRGSTHYPAYKLTDLKAERLGRINKSYAYL